MRGTTIAGVAAIGFVLNGPVQDQADILFAVPQQDGWRSRMSPASASVSADGRYIALASYAQLAPADTDVRADIYVLDRASGYVTLESPAADGRPLEGDSAHPRLSGDGRYLVFEAVMRAATDARPGVDVVLRDRSENITTLVSRNTSGAIPNGWSGSAAISDDGRIVVFASTATDLVAGRDENGDMQDVYLFNAATGVIRRISVDSRGIQSPDGASFGPSLSGDGRYVAFTSTAELDAHSGHRRVNGSQGSRRPLADPRGRPMSYVYLRDTQLNLTRRVTLTAEGLLPDGPSREPVISRDGLYVGFVSEATNLTPGDRNRSADVFLNETRTGSTILVSRCATGGAANGASGNPAISGDGRFLAFQSQASDLVCARRCQVAAEDINLLPDIFLFDRTTGAVTWISTGAAGGWMEESSAPALDASGEIVAFSSRHPIDERDVANDFDLFVRVSPR